MDKKVRADLIEEVIQVLDSQYWDDDIDPILPVDIGEELSYVDQTSWKFEENVPFPDTVYDALRKELKSLRPNSFIFSNTHASTKVIKSKKIKHNPPMVSIAKACNEDKDKQESQLFKWIDECIKESSDKIKKSRYFSIDGKKYNGQLVRYPEGYFAQSYKLDGVAIALYYVDGYLVSAGTRPRDGINGEDVTEQAQYVNGIPKKLNEDITCSIRGEIICLKKDFEEVQKELIKNGEEPRKNERSHANGIKQMNDPSKVKDMKLTFIAHGLEGMPNPPFKTVIEKAKYASKNLGIRYVRVEEFNFYDLKKMEDIAGTLDYRTDGVVIEVNDIEEQEQLGRIGDSLIGDPKGKIAWKFSEEKASAIIKDIEWATGRTSVIKPVATFDPVVLADTNVSRATLHNIGMIFRKGIGIGTRIFIIKSGNIIPKVVGVDEKTKVKKPAYPDKCPSCGAQTKLEHTPAYGRQPDMYELYCTNDIDCPSQIGNKLEHFIKSIGVLGLGKSIISSLIQGKKVREFSDFYKINQKDVMDCGLAERESLLVIASIQMIDKPEKMDSEDLINQIEKSKKNKKIISLPKLFSALGIEAAGKSAGKAICDQFNGDFDRIRNANIDELKSVPNVGDKTSENIYSFFRDNKSVIDELLKYIDIEKVKTGPLTGKTFVFTGGFDGGKSLWEGKVEALGGKIVKSVSKEVNYVVEGTDAGSKIEKAKALAKKRGIKECDLIINIEKLKKEFLNE